MEKDLRRHGGLHVSRFRAQHGALPSLKPNLMHPDKIPTDKL